MLVNLKPVFSGERSSRDRKVIQFTEIILMLWDIHLDAKLRIKLHLVDTLDNMFLLVPQEWFRHWVALC
uniref:Uncharacterized protein n=1 Tax=uncultured microorganism TaxID=358574 RepID=I2FJM7_9ZZZZ|nr:hypothetical protein [uncultured microorganism]